MSNHWGWLLGIAMSTTGYALCEYFWANSASAQISPDATLPNNSIITPQGNILNITGGSQIGNNLFHSFKEFSIPTGGTAFFNNALDIGNIISRVTGNSISNIDGLIRANGSANVFLLNPNGIIFGNNASLNVGGSFVGSTANAIQFGTAGIFSASTPNAPTPLLTINPSALLFLQPSPAAITSSSTAPAGVNLAGVEVTGLRVPDGRSLVLVGGDVNIDGGSLRAYNGRIELAGLAAPGNIGLNFTGNILSLGVPDVPRANVSLTNGAELNVRGSDAGSIAINAQNLSLAGASKVRAGIDTGLGTPQSIAGDIDINATGSTTLIDDSFIANVPQTSSFGKGGNINITTGSLALINGSSLNTGNFGQGDGGNINLNVRDALTLSGVGEAGSSAILSSVQAQAVGKGGSINITAGSVSLADDAELSSSTFGQGDAGNVSIQARDFVSLASSSTIFSTVEAGGVGNGGNINITASSLSLQDGSQLQTILRNTDTQNNLLGGRGNAGNVNIDVNGAVIIAGQRNGLPSGIRSLLGTGATGNAGNINIKSGSFSLADGAELSSSTFGQGDAGNVSIQARDFVSLAGSSTIFSTVEAGGVGNGGNINITASSLSLQDGSQLQTILRNSDTENNLLGGRGNAGNVNIDVNGAVIIAGQRNGLPSGIRSFVGTGATGNAGNINIKSGSFSLADDAELTSSTFGQGNAANVSIQTRDFVSLAGSSNIFSNVEAGGVGNGGNINITASSLSLTDGSQLQTILRNTDTQNNLLGGRGNAGNVNIDVSSKVAISGVKDELRSAIFSRVETGAIGNSGDINIKSGSLELSNGAQLNSSTFGQGNAGNVSIQASDAVSLANANIFSSVEAGSVGNGGNINIKAGSLTLTDGAQLITNVEAANETLLGGRGNAGNVNIDVSGKVTISGVKDEFGSAILSRLRTAEIGNGGDINIKSGSFELSNGALLSASTFGQGNAGSVFIQASDAVSLANADIFSNVQPGAVGNSGNINVQARTLSLTDDSSLFASTSGQGNAGNISVQVTDSVSLANSIIFSNVADGAVGNAGNINVQARTLSLTDNSSLLATTFGQGNGGNISIQATDSVFLAGKLNGITTNVSAGAVGNAGNINIQTGLFSLTDESQVGATNLGGKGSSGNILINTANDFSITRGAFVSAASSGEGNAGKITIRSGGAVLISGRGDRTSSSVDNVILDSGVGNGGDIEIQARSFSLSDGADLFTFTSGRGNAGNISINTIDDFTLKNASVAATFTSGQGNAGKIAILAGGNVSISDRANLLSSVAPEGIGSGGDIEIQGRSFSLSDNAQLFTATLGKGDAGNFQINTSGDIIIKSGGQLRADTFGQGNAGNVSVNAGGTISLDGVGSDGFSSAISTQVTAEEGFVGRGEGGNINITAQNLSITNRAALTSSSLGQGNAGDININTRSVRLDNQGIIAASTNSGNGGNINLTAADFLLLRRNSSISTTAGLTQSGGDGGNININTPFIVAIPNENSDITANAFTGNGGRVNITSQGLFGIEARSQPTPQSDITASSQFGLSGEVIINTPDIDPTQGLVELPTGLTDVSRLVDTSCGAIAKKNGSEFTVTGRGGLPPSPDDFLSSDVVWTDTRLSATVTQQPSKTAIALSSSKPKAVEIVPATGWVFNNQTGEVTLISSASNASGFASPTCAQR